MSRFYRLTAAVVMYVCLGCFFIRYDFVNVGLWSLGVLIFGAGSIVGGLLQERFESARVAYTGATVFGLGFIAAGGASTSGWHYFANEFLIGFGCGIAYSAGIPLVARWFPDRVGLAIGTAVAGVVPASFVVGGIARLLIERVGWRMAAAITGVTLFVVLVIAIRVLATASADHALSSSASAVRELGPAQMVRTRLFFVLFSSYVLTSTAAIMIYSTLSGFSDLASRENRRAAAMVALVGPVGQLANAGARVLAGGLCDYVGNLRTTLWAPPAVILLAGLVALVAQSPGTLVAVSFLAFGGYGATLAIYPTVTLSEYGSRHLGANYGIVFNGWACGYIAGGYLAAQMLKMLGDRAGVLYVAMFVSFSAILLARKAAGLASPTVVDQPLYS